MLEALGISGATIVLCILLYLVVRFAVKHGVKSAYYDIMGLDKSSSLAENLKQSLLHEKTKTEREYPPF